MVVLNYIAYFLTLDKIILPTFVMHIIRYLFSLLFLQDIDECDNENGNCSQFCNNTIGSYQCYCEDGYILDSDDHTCYGMYITSSVHYFEVQI